MVVAGAGAVGRLVVRAVLVFAIAILIVLGLGPLSGRYRCVTVLSGSMAPTLPVGGVVLSTPEPLGRVRVGQIISFHAPIPGRPVETHRVVEVLAGGAHPVIRTQGDANPAPDGWVARLDTGPVWRARAVVPALGRVVHVLRSPIWRPVLIWLAPALFVVVALIEIWGTGPGREQAVSS